MSALTDLRTRVQSVNDALQTGELVRNAVVRHGSDIMELQKTQLLLGLTSSGEDFRPYYSEDLKPSGYFHSVETAGRYASWKESGIRYPYSVSGRNPDAPNLYITGKFYDEIDVEFGNDAVAVIGMTGFAKTIMAKYGNSSFGLMASNWRVLFMERGAYAELMDEMKTMLYGRN